MNPFTKLAWSSKRTSLKQHHLIYSFPHIQVGVVSEDKGPNSLVYPKFCSSQIETTKMSVAQKNVLRRRTEGTATKRQLLANNIVVSENRETRNGSSRPPAILHAILWPRRTYWYEHGLMSTRVTGKTMVITSVIVWRSMKGILVYQPTCDNTRVHDSHSL